jgi:hypothetical protein
LTRASLVATPIDARHGPRSTNQQTQGLPWRVPRKPAALQLPSRALPAEKTAFGASRRARWFGLDG